MLKRENRLTSPISGKIISNSSTLFLVKLGKNDLAKTRVGFIASKKIDKRAVIRNRIKRIFRNEIEKRFEEITEGSDLLFIINKESLSAKREEISKEITKSLKNLNILK